MRWSKVIFGIIIFTLVAISLVGCSSQTNTRSSNQTNTTPSTVSTSTKHTFKNEPTGFRGIPWGASIEKVRDQMIFIAEDDSGTKHYFRKDESMEFGTAKATSVSYLFWHNKLWNVVIFFKNLSDYLVFEDILTHKYGLGTKPYGSDMQHWEWEGDTAKIILSYIPDKNKGYLIFTSKKVFNEIRDTYEAKNRSDMF